MTTEQEAPQIRRDGEAMGAGRPRSRPTAGAIAVRLLRHEWTLAVGAGLLLAVVTWPTLRDVTHTIPQDIGDPTLQAWQIAWRGHILLTDPTQLWHSNTFFPEPYTYAYSDTLLGYAPAGTIGDGPVAAVVRYNILYVLVHALAVRRGVRPGPSTRGEPGGRGAGLAGVSFAYATWRLAQAGHLHILSTGGIALALAMLVREHGWSAARLSTRATPARLGLRRVGGGRLADHPRLRHRSAVRVRPRAGVRGGCARVRLDVVAARGPSGVRRPVARGGPVQRCVVRCRDAVHGVALPAGGGPASGRPPDRGLDRDVLPAVARLPHRARGVVAVGRSAGRGAGDPVVRRGNGAATRR
jgi:hypothetical protein